MRIKSLLFFLWIWVIVSCNQSEEEIYLQSVDQYGKSINQTTSTSDKFDQNNAVENSEIKDCGDPVVYELIAGQNIDVGEITVTNDDTKIYITYETSGDWWLTETHLFVGEKSDLPVTQSGNPKIGHFPYHGEHGHVQSVQFTVDINNNWSANHNGELCIIISMHASVVSKNSEGIIKQSETAFGKGELAIEFNGSRWGWYHNFCLNTCDYNDENESNSSSENGNDGSGHNTNEPGGGGDLTHFGFIKNDIKDCFSFQELNQLNWGWANQFDYNSLIDPQSQEYPIYIQIEDNCSENSLIEVGKVSLTILGSNTEYPELEMKYTLMTNYKMKGLEVYVGWINPISNGALTNSITFQKMSLDTNSYSFKKGIIDWPGIRTEGEAPKFYVISKVSI
ncbi:hypothetical protein [Namhaeicola litoreus]|uniref:Uncharacterized protein n=1 Tax=Namhaeicola litoreus TaxID=1052145 RepID=A0ABW3Y4V5_9FLAO